MTIRTATPGKDRAPATRPVDPARPVAIIVSHGMGQQVPFESLQDVTRALAAEQERILGADARPTVNVEAVKLGEGRSHRARLTLTTPSGDREVHVYECYWAPLAEGQISSWETFWFLVTSGLRGIAQSRLLRLRRFLFGHTREFELQLSIWIQYAGATGVVMALFFLGAAALAHMAGVFIPGLRLPEAIDRRMLQDVYLAFVGIALVVAGIAIALALRALLRARPGHQTPWRAVEPLLWLPTLAGVAIVTAAGVATAFHALGFEAPSLAGRLRDVLVGGPRWIVEQWRLPAWVPWLLVLGVAWRISIVLRQYVGDVAAYVSSHEVNRFHQVRQDILKRCSTLASSVYAHADDGGRFVYDRVIVLGHSLGSVISYDWLNDLLLCDAVGMSKLEVDRRTDALITFGSPLDKIAFLYRTQRGPGSDVREAGSTSAQPLITSYRFRPRTWINIHAGSDWISGSLDYFDDPSDPESRERGVVNLRDAEAFTPFLAHTEYWRNHTLPVILHWVVAQ
jgi:hypothetical protein